MERFIINASEDLIPVSPNVHGGPFPGSGPPRTTSQVTVVPPAWDSAWSSSVTLHSGDDPCGTLWTVP